MGWVLILVMNMGGAGAGGVSMAHFDNEAACRGALLQAQSLGGAWTARINGICVPEG